MAEQAASKDKDAKPAPAGGGSKTMPLLLVVNTLILAGVIAFVLLRPASGGGAHPATPAAPAREGGGHEGGGEKAGKPAGPGVPGGPASDLPGPTLRLPDFVVHLRNTDSDRYARMSFEIEVATEEDKTRLNAFMPHIRDDFIGYLSDRTIEELRGSEAIGRTKQALTERLAKVAPNVTIRALYLTDLVVQ